MVQCCRCNGSVLWRNCFWKPKEPAPTVSLKKKNKCCNRPNNRPSLNLNMPSLTASTAPSFTTDSSTMSTSWAITNHCSRISWLPISFSREGWWDSSINTSPVPSSVLTPEYPPLPRCKPVSKGSFVWGMYKCNALMHQVDTTFNEAVDFCVHYGSSSFEGCHCVAPNCPPKATQSIQNKRGHWLSLETPSTMGYWWHWSPSEGGQSP